MRIGQTAPDFELPDHEGNRRSLSGMLSRGPVMLFAAAGRVRQLLSVKRTTFVIDRNRVVRLVVSSGRAHVHADKELNYLRYLA